MMKKDRREYRYRCERCGAGVIVQGRHEIVCRNCKTLLCGVAIERKEKRK